MARVITRREAEDETDFDVDPAYIARMSEILNSATAQLAPDAAAGGPTAGGHTAGEVTTGEGRTAPTLPTPDPRRKKVLVRVANKLVRRPREEVRRLMRDEARRAASKQHGPRGAKAADVGDDNNDDDGD
jgi:hypothetical protein